MKNKKLLKALAALTLSAAAAGCVSLFGCSHTHTFKEEWKNDDPSGHWYEATCEHKEEKKDFEVHKYDDDNDVDCNVCGYEREVTPPAPPAPEHNYDTSKWAYDAVEHYHACTDADCNERIDVAKHTLNDDKECTVCHAKFTDMTYAFEPTRLDAGQYKDGISSGIFSVVADGKVRTRERLDKPVLKPDSDEVVVESFSNTIYDESGTQLFGGKSVQMDGSKRGFAINAIAPGTLTFYAENGSSSVKETDYQKVVLTKPDGTELELSYLGKGIRAVTVELDQVGLYTITRGANSTTDVYYAKFDTVVPMTAVEKIQIAEKGTVEYIVGQDFDHSKLQVQIVRETTGMIEPLDLSSESVTIDSSAFDKEHGGTYKIVITYKDESNKEFKADYDVTVYAVEAIQLGFNKIIQGNNSSAGNGTYVNHAVQQFYFKGQELDLDGLTVKTVFKDGKQAFIVTEGYTVSGFNKDTAGKQTVKVTWDGDTTKYAEFTVYVADYAASSIETTAELVTINVNGAIEDENVGTLYNGAYRFKTIQQALDFLGALELGENTKKVINLAEGTYEEKLEINIPNLTIKGANSEDATKTVIEWDSLYGIADEGGFLHTTDSTATLNVRENATGFVIEDVTISNWYNSTEHFDEVFGEKYGEHRALAMLIQADKVVIDNCRLLGYQDTIEFFTGRQVVQNSYINGRTDFIFGTNNTTYFYNCEIESIESTGYITAFKGCNKGANDYVTYGAIFDHCKFTCSENVDEGTTAIGRPWAAYAAVAVINSELGKHISKAGYDGGSSGTRYVNMSGTAPTVDTAKFVEYNNSGAAALIYSAADQEKDETHVAGTHYAVAGMKLLTAEQAANYSDKSVIFGTTNGLVTYSTAWDGGKGVEITEKTYKFSDYYVSGDEFNAQHAADNESVFGGDATITGTWGHELNQNKDHAKFVDGAVIKFNIAGKITVTTFGQSYGLPENVRISYKDGYATITIVKTSSSPITNGCYITLIKLDKSETPEDSEIKYNFLGLCAEDKSNHIQGTVAEPAEAFDGDITVVGRLRDNGNSYQATAGTVITFAKKGEVSIEWFPGQGSADNASIFYSNGYAELTIIGNPYINSITLDTSVIPSDSTVIFEEDKVIDLTALSTAYEGNTGRYEGIEIDATNGKFANNNSGWIQMNKDTVLKVTVAEGISVSVVEYQNAGKISVSERDTDGIVTITATDATYIKSVAFTIVKIYDNDAVVDLTKLGTAYEGNTGSYKGILIDATNGKFANNNGGWIQMNTGTVIKVHVGEGIVVSVTEYQDKGLVAIGERDAEGWVSITATGNTYISTVKMVLPLVRISEDYTYTYSQGNRTDGTFEVGNNKVKFDNCKVNNSWLAYGTITLDVAKDATITIKGSQYDGEIKINDQVVEHTVDGNYWVYTFYVSESDEGVVTISSSKGYLSSIIVSFGEEEAAE